MNSGYDVLKVGDMYYLCFQGVWFSSKGSGGPWVATTKVPAEIYTIPADSPVQHVTYVTVIDDDENYPTYGYTAGYMGMTVAFGCAMWGTGYYYPLLSLRAGIPGLLPETGCLRLRCVVQPLDRRLRLVPSRVRSLWRRRARLDL